MGIDFAATFGKNAAPAAATSNDRQAQPKAQFWLNIGYDSGVEDENGTTRFVALPLGIPLDTMKPVDTKSQNESYRAFKSAQNELWDLVMAHANDMAPGASDILNLQIQLRRVAADVAPVESDTNPFVRSLNLVG